MYKTRATRLEPASVGVSSQCMKGERIGYQPTLYFIRRLALTEPKGAINSL